MKRWVTPLTIGLFLVSGISGMALVFHLAGYVFHGMHERLSIGFFVLVLLHVWRNRVSLGAYARTPMVVALALTLGPAVVMGAWSVHRGRGRSANEALELMTEARIADLAVILKTTPEEMNAKLTRRKLHVGPDDTLAGIAAAAHVNPLGLLVEVTPERPERAAR